jgi:hypothetical protein
VRCDIYISLGGKRLSDSCEILTVHYILKEKLLKHRNWCLVQSWKYVQNIKSKKGITEKLA